MFTSIKIEDTNGNRVEGVPVFVPKRRKVGVKFVMLFLDQLAEIALDKELAGRHFRILLYLLSATNFENIITGTVADQAKGMGMDKANYLRSLKVLIKKGLIIKCGRYGNSNVYMMSPNIAWRGKLHNLIDERKKPLDQMKTETIAGMLKKVAIAGQS